MWVSDSVSDFNAANDSVHLTLNMYEEGNDYGVVSKRRRLSDGVDVASRYSADSSEKELGEWLKGQRRRHRLKSYEDSVRIGSVSRTKREWMSELDACWTAVQKKA